MRSFIVATLVALTGACIAPYPQADQHRPAQAMLQPASAPSRAVTVTEAHVDRAVGGADCAVCAGLSATPPPTGHDDGPGGADCAICAGLNATPPPSGAHSDTPGGHGPPPGLGAGSPGPPQHRAGPR